MVNRELRRQLSQDLRWLATGRITNDQFDDAYYDRYFDADDNAVKSAAEFGYCLYSDNRCYRLKGRHALDAATRRTVAMCVLFLRTDLEYDWPKQPSQALPLILYVLAYFGIAVGIALLICSVPLLLGGIRDVEFLWPVAAFGLTTLVWSVWYRTSPKGFAAAYNSPEWRAWRDSGDFDVWPFCRREDCYQARRTAHLLNSEAR